ncbi:MAG: hypothetical protein LBG80_19970 [Bacteroidales bacterium]|nr:hypothetical protein [Bacteroidales bacterium]
MYILSVAGIIVSVAILLTPIPNLFIIPALFGMVVLAPLYLIDLYEEYIDKKSNNLKDTTKKTKP